MLSEVTIAALFGALLGVVMGPDAKVPQEYTAGATVLLLVGCATLLMNPKKGFPKSLPKDAVPVTLTGDDKKDFTATFDALTQELLKEIEKYKLPPRTIEYMKRMVEYNVPKGKLTRGLTVITAYKSIKGVTALSPIEYRRAATLGWVVEWLQAMFLVMDDIMDESETRRGQVCWYLRPDVKMNAINDGLMLECHIYVLLKKYFGNDPVYVRLLELLHETTHQTSLGQFLDLTTAEPAKVRRLSKSPASIWLHATIVFTPKPFSHIPSRSTAGRLLPVLPGRVLRHCDLQDGLLLLLSAMRPRDGARRCKEEEALRPGQGDMHGDRAPLPGAGRLPRLLRGP